MSTVGLVLMDANHAKAMCANVSLQLVAAGDADVNVEMKGLCPSATFFDIRAKAAANLSACNHFVIESTGELATFFNWGPKEPDNGLGGNMNTNFCSMGPIEESCVGFEPRDEVRSVVVSSPF